MIQVHSTFLDELEDYLMERPADDEDASRFIAQIETYFDNQSKINKYQDETMAFIAKELSN